MKLPNTLFFKTATTLTVSLLLLSIIILASTAYFVMVPVGKRSADDLSALLVLASQTWVELPPETRPDFESELMSAHGIKLIEAQRPLQQQNHIPIHIYLRLLQRALERRLGNTSIVTVGMDNQQPDWVWIDLPAVENFLRFGISTERIGARPPNALLAMAVAILVLAFGTAVILARRLTQPLEMFSQAITGIGKGDKKIVAEDNGPDEIITLARNFNRMSHEVSELLENRTTLLAGISHDLRTPLTRIRLALEINSAANDSKFNSQLETNIDEMEQLLEQALLLARGIDKKEPLKKLDLVSLLSTLASQLDAEWMMQHPESKSHVRFESSPTTGSNLICSLPEQSLLRVLRNLLENALRYGNDKEVMLSLSWQDNAPLISILDRGPGIPKDQLAAVFLPFYRVEGSRNIKTGGSGLGLAIVYQLCQALGWEITLLPRKGGGNKACLWLRE